MTPTSWTTFPDHYKFIDIEILVDTTKYEYSMVTYGLLIFFGDCGGILQAL